MSLIASYIKDRLADLDLEQQKDFASKLHTLLERVEPVSFATVQPKLSKLLAGEEEGERYFFGKPKRLEVLAQILGVKVEDLAKVYEVSSKGIALVLDPRLSADVARFLREQEPCAEGRYRCVVVDVVDRAKPEEIRNRLKDAVRRERNAWVVTNTVNDQDAAFFGGAEIRTTTVKKVPRGWSLVELSDLVPIPPPREPRFWDDEGNPLALDETVTKMALHRDPACGEYYRRKIGERQNRYGCEESLLLSFPEHERRGVFLWVELWERGGGEIVKMAKDAKENGEQPTYPLHYVVGDLCSIGRPTRWDGETCLFWKERTIYVVGPKADEVAQRLAPSHVVEVLDWDGPVRDALAGRNWRVWWSPGKRAGSFCALSSLALAVFEQFKGLVEGVCFRDGMLRRLIDYQQDESRAIRSRFEGIEGSPIPTLVDEEKCRGELVRALARPMASSWGSTHLVLRQIAQGELTPMRCDSPVVLDAMVNLGAGNYARVVIIRYREDPTESLEFTSLTSSYSPDLWGYRHNSIRWELDGGDVHVWIEILVDRWLEGSRLQGRARREAEHD